MNQFTCPYCGGSEFYLIYDPPPTPEQLAEASTELPAMMLSIFANDSWLIAYCVQDCPFRTSVTEVELQASREDAPSSTSSGDEIPS